MTTPRRELMILVAAACLVVTLMPLFAQDDAIDMNKARALRKKQKQGETLTAEEKEYLERAIALRKQGSRGNKDLRRGADKENTEREGRGEKTRRPPTYVPGVEISEEVSPVRVVELKSKDGVDLSFAYRSPPGKGPFPVVIFCHGGGLKADIATLKENLLKLPIQTRFLKQGFITVEATRRHYWVNPRTRQEGWPTGFYDAVKDNVTVVEKVKTLPGVDPDKVILYGGSGGGILVIVTASQADVACVIAGEPATVVTLLPNEGKGRINYMPVCEKPHDYYKGESKAQMLDWMAKIKCPILILHGDAKGRKNLFPVNKDLLVPEMKKLDKDISIIVFEGSKHGFYWGKAGATKETVEKIMTDSTNFIRKSFRPNGNTDEAKALD